MAKKNTRSRPRQQVDWRSSWSARDGSVKGDGIIRDISPAGLLVESQSDLSVGERVRVWFPSPNRTTQLQVDCTVRWVGKSFFGAEFAHLEPELERYLHKERGGGFST